MLTEPAGFMQKNDIKLSRSYSKTSTLENKF